jgi:hypothetical protein
MSHQITIEMSDRAYDVLAREAAAHGTTPAVVAASALEQRFAEGNGAARRALTEAEIEEGRQRFERHFGEVSVPSAVGLDNEQIDADLAREYADRHEES